MAVNAGEPVNAVKRLHLQEGKEYLDSLETDISRRILLQDLIVIVTAD